MDWQFLFNVAVPIVGAIVTLIVLPWLRSIRQDATQAIDEARGAMEKLTLFKLDVAEKYVTHSDVQDIKAMLTQMSSKLEGWMQHINDRLDRKQDR